MKILAIAATNHKNSINKQLLEYTATMTQKHFKGDVEIEVLDLTDYEIPFYRQDREEADGIPEKAQALYSKIGFADAVFISFAEHNGGYTAVYKNIFDWMSRINIKVYQGKPALFLSTSPGASGAASVLKSAETSAPFWGADLKGTFSLPSFYDNFDLDSGTLTNTELKNGLLDILKNFKKA